MNRSFTVRRAFAAAAATTLFVLLLQAAGIDDLGGITHILVTGAALALALAALSFVSRDRRIPRVPGERR